MTYRRIGILGSGRAAKALGLALAPHSHEPLSVWGRSAERADAAVAAIGKARRAETMAAIGAGCDLVLLAVSDDAIARVAHDLACGIESDGPAFVAHVSGRSGAEILAPLRTIGARTAAIHPAMTFTGDPAREAARMRDAWFAITGSSAEATEQAHGIVRLVGGRATEIAEAHRPLYHAALCHASNHLVTLLADAFAMLDAAQVDESRALVAPLVRAALENSLANGFEALSGPLLRGDIDTVRAHLAGLHDFCPDRAPAYRAMAQATLDGLDRSGRHPPPALSALVRDGER